MKHNWKVIVDPKFQILCGGNLLFNERRDGLWGLFKICMYCKAYVYQANNRKYYQCETVSGIKPTDSC